jgi:hypothetical protein
MLRAKICPNRKKILFIIFELYKNKINKFNANIVTIPIFCLKKKGIKLINPEVKNK